MDETQHDRLLTQLKTWAPKPTELDGDLYDALVDAALARTLDATLNFLNYEDGEDLPPRLESLVVAMCTQLIKTNNVLQVGHDEDGGKVVSSLTEGDTSISFVDPSAAYAAIQAANPITIDYLGELYNFRKLPQ